MTITNSHSKRVLSLFPHKISHSLHGWKGRLKDMMDIQIDRIGCCDRNQQYSWIKSIKLTQKFRLDCFKPKFKTIKFAHCLIRSGLLLKGSSYYKKLLLKFVTVFTMSLNATTLEKTVPVSIIYFQ